MINDYIFFFFFSSRRRHTRCYRDWSSDVCSSDLIRKPELRNEPIDITGLEALTFPEMAERLSAVLGRSIRYIAVEEPSIRRAMAARTIPEWKVDIAIGIEKAMEAGLHAGMTSRLRAITGKASRTIDEFIREHRVAFRPISKTVPSW